MQTYKETHPWITFKLNLGDSSGKLWMLLGQVQAMCENISGVPLLPSVAEMLNQVYLAKGIFATTSIEGNTLTEEQVKKRLSGELKLPPSKQYLGTEIDNVLSACNRIIKDVLEGRIEKLIPSDVKMYNGMVLENLEVDEDVIPGQTRAHQVTVGRYLAPSSQYCDELLAKLCEWLNNGFDPPQGYEQYKMAFGVLQAIVAHLYIAWIHPFGDGNGRTARLIEVQLLLITGVPSTSSHLLSDHYNQTRTEYYRQLDRSSRSGGDILPFIEYALQGLVDGLNGQMKFIQSQQLMVHWINFVHDSFRNKSNKTDLRRKHLVLDMSMTSEPLAIGEIRYVTPRIAEAYAGKADKTIQRDINKVIKMSLVVKEGNKYRVNREQMLAFLPPTLQP